MSEGPVAVALIAQPPGFQPALVQFGEFLAGLPLLGAAAPCDQSHAGAPCQAGDTAGSVRHFRQALEITRRAVAEDPQYSAARMEVASAEASLGHALLSQGRPETIAEACASLDRVKAFWTELRAKGELPPGETAELEQLSSWRGPCPSSPR